MERDERTASIGKRMRKRIGKEQEQEHEQAKNRNRQREKQRPRLQ
jgi:hypothetical protein